jgi:NADH-quinone oxidoreductase subunit E
LASCSCGASAQDPREEKLNRVLHKYANREGALIPVLQEAQAIYGYLPKPVVKRIASVLKLPLSRVYGVVTFYAQFHLEPRGRNIVRVCLGTACHVRGGAKILDRVKNELQIGENETTEDLRFTLEPVACIGACGLAPVMTINDNTHGRLAPEAVPDILDQYE